VTLPGIETHILPAAGGLGAHTWFAFGQVVEVRDAGQKLVVVSK
jgi:hypothetical protein